MGRMKIPDSPDLNYTYYNNLRGIDLSNDASECSRNHAADLLNMVPDATNGAPVKRRGWRKIYDFGSRILDMIDFHDVTYIATSSGVYTADGTLIGSLTATKATFFTFGSSLYLMADKYYIVGSSLAEITPYIPTTIISQKPDGSGGVAYEGINALTDTMAVQFLGDSSSTDYYVTRFTNGKWIDSSSKNISIKKVEVRNSNGDWAETTAYTGLMVNSGSLMVMITVGVKFTEAHAPVVAGQDNVRITFSCVTQNADLRAGLISSGVMKTYGYVNMDRLFISIGNKIYYSDTDNPLFFPDDNYLVLNGVTSIVGFHRKGSYLVALASGATEHSIYLISGATMAQTMPVENADGSFTSQSTEIQYFKVQPAISGTTAIGGDTFCSLVDDPLFLSETGIYAIVSNSYNSETMLTNRSAMINSRLIKETNLSNACAAVWNGLYILCVNSHCYVLDSRNTVRASNNNNGYECYYFDNVPANLLLAVGEELYFAYGNILCKFNTDVDNFTAFSDGGILGADGLITGGTAITSLYALRLDSDNYPQYFKTLNKKGTVIEMMPYQHSYVKLYFSKDGEYKEMIGETYVDVFRWSLIDFDRFTFNGNDKVKDYYPHKKIKKYKYLQFILENDRINEPFGIIGLTKTWTIGNFAK